MHQPKRWPEKEMREPLVGWDGRPLALWAELLAFPLSALFAIAFWASEVLGVRPGQK